MRGSRRRPRVRFSLSKATAELVRLWCARSHGQWTVLIYRELPTIRHRVVDACAHCEEADRRPSAYWSIAIMMAWTITNAAEAGGTWRRAGGRADHPVPGGRTHCIFAI